MSISRRARRASHGLYCAPLPPDIAGLGLALPWDVAAEASDALMESKRFDTGPFITTEMRSCHWGRSFCRPKQRARRRSAHGDVADVRVDIPLGVLSVVLPGAGLDAGAGVDVRFDAVPDCRFVRQFSRAVEGFGQRLERGNRSEVVEGLGPPLGVVLVTEPDGSLVVVLVAVVEAVRTEPSLLVREWTLAIRGSVHWMGRRSYG